MKPRLSPISTDTPLPMKEENAEEEAENNQLILKPAEWIPKLISLQADIIYNCIVFIISQIVCFLSMASDSYHRAEQTVATMETAVGKVPSKITPGSCLILKKILYGCVGAMQVFMVLVVLLVVAAVLGVVLVELCVEEPMFVTGKLFFDYTNENPEAVFSFGGDDFGGRIMSMKTWQSKGVPVGHTYQVCVVLLMPESDFNRDIGVFQLTAEVLSSNGDVIAKCSRPCLLHFRSFPIRLIGTFLMGIPMLLGISDETQKLSIKILKHKEGNRRTKAIRVILSPRAGTSLLPQLYEAEIVLNSKQPWTKEFVHNWKYTFYVWSSFYVYNILLATFICCCKPLLFPVRAGSRINRLHEERGQESEEAGQGRSRYEKGASESLRKWRLSRRKRKAVSSSASSARVSGDATSTVVEEDIGDSESVCN